MDERTVVLKPSFIEWGLYRDDYLGLARELEVEGVIVELVRPEGGPEWRNIDPTTARDLYDVVVSIGRIAQSVLGISDLVDRIRLRLRDPGREEERIGVIYLADGTKHEFPLDND